MLNTGMYRSVKKTSNHLFYRESLYDSKRGDDKENEREEMLEREWEKGIKRELRKERKK